MCDIYISNFAFPIITINSTKKLLVLTHQHVQFSAIFCFILNPGHQRQHQKRHKQAVSSDRNTSGR